MGGSQATKAQLCCAESAGVGSVEARKAAFSTYPSGDASASPKAAATTSRPSAQAATLRTVARRIARLSRIWFRRVPHAPQRLAICFRPSTELIFALSTKSVATMDSSVGAFPKVISSTPKTRDSIAMPTGSYLVRFGVRPLDRTPEAPRAVSSPTSSASASVLASPSATAAASRFCGRCYAS